MKKEWLGYANGWSQYEGWLHPRVRRCKELRHTRQGSRVGNCLYLYWCDECNYEYKEDSSD